MSEVVADHSPKPSLKRIIKDTPTECISVNGFGEVRREVPGGYYWQVLEVGIKEKSDLDRFQFDDPLDGSRYTGMEKGSSMITLKPEEALVYDGEHYRKIDIPYYAQYDSKKNNVSILGKKSVTQKVQKKRTKK